MPTIAIVLCKYVLAIALVRINFVYLYYLSLCKLVAKVNYNMFQSQTFRMWRRHAAATKNNDGRSYICVRKTQTNQSCGVSRRHKISVGSAHDDLLFLWGPLEHHDVLFL